MEHVFHVLTCPEEFSSRLEATLSIHHFLNKFKVTEDKDWFIGYIVRRSERFFGPTTELQGTIEVKWRLYRLHDCPMDDQDPDEDGDCYHRTLIRESPNVFMSYEACKMDYRAFRKTPEYAEIKAGGRMEVLIELSKPYIWPIGKDKVRAFAAASQ